MMINRALFITTAAGLAAVSAIALVDTRRISLSSRDGRREYRRVDTSGGVRLTKRLSDAPCTYGRTWGYDRNGVWVSDGCRAEFEIGGRYDDDRRDNNFPWSNRRDDRNDDGYGYGYGNGDTFRLESSDGRYRSISIDTRGGVELVRKLSDASCTYGRTWGYDQNRVWVDRGCRAVFQIGRGNGGYGGGYGGSYDSCPDWLPGRYSGYDNGDEFIVNIDRNGRVNLRRNYNGRWNDESGYYRDNSIYVGNWIFDVIRDRNNVNLRSKWDKNRRINLRKL
jgi:hypothetical protein